MKGKPLAKIVLLAVTLSLMLALVGTFGASALAAEPPSERASGLATSESEPPNRSAEAAKQKQLIPTHVQVATVTIPLGDQTATIHSFCLDRTGNLLATSGGEQITLVRGKSGMELKLVDEPSGIHVISPDGDLRATWPLKVTPQAINVGPDGCVYCGGQGRIAKLDPHGKLLTVVDAPNVAGLRPLPSLEVEDDQKEFSEEEKKAKIAEFQKRLQAVTAELVELGGQQRAKEGDEDALAAINVEMEKAKAQYRRIAEGLSALTNDARTHALKMRSNTMRKRAVNGIAVTDKDAFIACPSAKGIGFEVWRTDLDLAEPKRIVTRLRGCCGQMDIQAHDGLLYAAENSRKRIVCYDRDGKKLHAWGDADRVGVESFGSCCNPMNIRFGPGGEVYTSESTLGRIKRYTPEGKFLGVVGYARLVPGCNHVAIGVSKDGDRVYLLDITRKHIVVMARRAESKVGRR